LLSDAYIPNQMTEDQLYSINQVAIILKVHQLTVRRYIKGGKLKALKIGGNVRVPQSSIDLFTHDINPTFPDVGVKNAPKQEDIFQFSLDDSIFRLKGRGLSIRAIK
jgi:excisionase family DNA binding protein